MVFKYFSYKFNSQSNVIYIIITDYMHRFSKDTAFNDIDNYQRLSLIFFIRYVSTILSSSESCGCGLQ